MKKNMQQAEQDRAINLQEFNLFSSDKKKMLDNRSMFFNNRMQNQHHQRKIIKPNNGMHLKQHVRMMMMTKQTKELDSKSSLLSSTGGG